MWQKEKPFISCWRNDSLQGYDRFLEAWGSSSYILDRSKCCQCYILPNWPSLFSPASPFAQDCEVFMPSAQQSLRYSCTYYERVPQFYFMIIIWYTLPVSLSSIIQFWLSKPVQNALYAFSFSTKCMAYIHKLLHTNRHVFSACLLVVYCLLIPRYQWVVVMHVEYVFQSSKINFH